LTSAQQFDLEQVTVSLIYKEIINGWCP